MRFRVIPVVDLKGRRAVHAVGGRRDQYRPLESVWQASGSPIGLARKTCAALGLDTIYLADLDAIEGETPSVEIYRAVAAGGLDVWVDFGVRDVFGLRALRHPDTDRMKVVVGLESIGGPGELAEIIDDIGADRVIFSLDLVDGSSRIAPGAMWSRAEPLDIAREAIERGVGQLIILDLARVGIGRGTGNERLLSQIIDANTSVAITVGGGIRDIEDVLVLKRAGVASVLVGSAIHDGRIGLRELERIREASGRQLESG